MSYDPYNSVEKQQSDRLSPEVAEVSFRRLAIVDGGFNTLEQTCIATGAIYPDSTVSSEMPGAVTEAPIEVSRPREETLVSSDTAEPTTLHDRNRNPLSVEQQRMVAEHIARVNAVHDQIDLKGAA